jgi:hypothetical protein
LISVSCKPRRETQVTGIVRDSITLEPIPYTMIQIHKFKLNMMGSSSKSVAYIDTDANGFYSFNRDLSKGSYSISAFHNNYESQGRDIEWGKSQKIDFLLKSFPTQVHLFIYNYNEVGDTIFFKVSNAAGAMLLDDYSTRESEPNNISIPLNDSQYIFIDWCERVPVNRCFKDSIFCPSHKTTSYNIVY